MKSNRRLLIFLLCYISYTAIYIARLNLSMASPDLKAAALLDEAQIGALGSAFSVIYAFGRLFNGWLSDRRPPWQMISLGLALAGISNLLFGILPPFAGMIVLWGANAFAQSMLWSSVLRVVASIYELQKAKKMTTWLVTSVAVGNILGILINTGLIQQFGLQWAFLIPGGLTLLCGGVVVLTMRKIASKAEVTAPTAFRSVLSNRELQIALIPSFLHGVMKDNISLWMTVYVVDRFGVQLDQSAYYVLLIPVVGMIGRMAYPFCFKLSREREHRVSIWAFLLCTAAAAALSFLVQSPLFAVICLSLIYAAVSLINTSMLSIFPIRFAQQGNVASVSGIMDFATYLGAGVASLAYGFLIQQWGYEAMFISWAVISFASIFILRIIDRKPATAAN